jgi:hypothetical protein
MSINVANNNPHVVYTVAEGATQTTFSITFEFFDDDEVQLYVDGIIKTQGSGDGNYTITGGEGSTGTATFNTVSSGIQPVTGITGGSQVVIARNIPIERVTDFSAGSDINRAALNTQLDTLTAIAADNKMRSVRALTAPITDPTDVGVSLVIPKAADRANGFLSFDSNGNAAINSVVDLSFLTLERLDIDNVRIDGNTLSSTTGNLILAPTADVEINIPASSSLYMQRAGITALDFAFTSVSQEVRFINTTTSTTFSSIKSTHVGGTSSDLSLNTDGGALNLNPSNGTLVLKDNDVQRGFFDLNTAQKIKVRTGTGSGILNTTFDGADVIMEGDLQLGASTEVASSSSTIKAPSTLTLDPANHGDNTGTVIIAGNLQVDGTTTTINSTTLTIDDKNIVLASGATDSAEANGAGITIDGASATIQYTHSTTSFDFNKHVNITGELAVSDSLNVDNITINGNTISSTDTDGNINLRCNGSGVVDVDSELFVYGNAINGTSAYVQIGNSGTGGDDVRIQGPNPNFSLYDSTAVVDGVAAYTGGVNFYGQKTNTAYHTYSTIRPRIINGLDSDTAKTGALHFGISDGANAAATNIIFKIEPDGIEVAGNITSTNDPLKISATTASASPNIILEGDSSPSIAIRGDGSNTNRLLLRYDDSNDFSYVSASGNLSIEASNTGHRLSLTSNDGMFITNGSSDMTITSSSSDIIFKTGTSGSTTERFKITGAGIVQSLVETQIVDETLKVTNGSTYGSLSMDENTGSGRDYFDIKAFGHDGSSTEGGAVRLFSASNLESIRTYSTGTTGSGYTTFNFPYDLTYGTGVYHLTVASANRSGLYLRSDVSGSDADGKQYGELSASSSEFKMVGWFGANIEFKIGGDGGEDKIAEISSTGIDVTGTVTADKLTVDKASGSLIDLNATASGTPGNYITYSDTGGATAYVGFDSGTNDNFTVYNATATGDITLRTNSLQRLNIDGATGDISFYEDTGTTAKFFWDASEESLGIGTSSPASRLDIRNTGGTYDKGLSIQTNSGGNIGTIWTTLYDLNLGIAGAHIFTNYDGSSERMRIDSSGNVGIGVVPEAWSSLYGTKALQVGAQASLSDINGDLHLSSNAYYDTTNARWEYINADYATKYTQTDGVHQWLTAVSGSADTAITWSQNMTLDASGNLLVGKNSASVTTTGVEARANGILAASRDADVALQINRSTNDGVMARFSKDGSTVGSIGSTSGVVSYIILDPRSSAKGAGLLGSSIDANTGILQPVDKVGALADDAIELGTNVNRFKNLYLSGGVVFGSTGGSVTSKTLDDYEEGTWTPVVSGSGTAGTYTTTITYAKYTKVGKVVTVSAYLGNITESSAGSGYVQITGLPFTKESGHYFAGTAWVSQWDYPSTVRSFALEPTTYSGTSTTFYIHLGHDNASASNLLLSEIVSGLSDIGITATYFAT